MEASLTGDFLRGILKELNELIDKGQEVLQYLTEILTNSGEMLINDIVIKIQEIIDESQKVLESAGECGISQLDNLINLGKEETEAAKTCVTDTLPKLGQVIINNFSNIFEHGFESPSNHWIILNYPCKVWGNFVNKI